jgi:T5SS/PEP-CTERM-associated repeat protein
VTNGGELLCGSAQLSNSLPSVVSGSNSLWNTSGQLYLGSYALLTVEDGGQITANTLVSDSDQFIVSGSNSLISAQQSISVGFFGYDASIEVTEDAQMQSQMGLVTGLLTVTNGGLAQIDSKLQIFAPGIVALYGGSINVGSSNSAPAPNILRVSAGGTLESAGAVFGNIVVASGGLMSAGNVDGTAAVNGNYEQDPGGQLSLNLSGTNASSGYDELYVTGDISLAGTLTLNFLNGFASKTGQTFSLINYGGHLAGNFDQIQINGLAPGFQYQWRQTNDALSLVSQNDGVATSSPLLSLNRTGNEVSISWPDTAAGYTLQSSTNLNLTNWTNLTAISNQFTTPALGAMQFFRLVKPGS